jgi:alpha-D-ribose 1-methylphosphonate 5-triphosphate synthase subunit PhnH
MMNESTPSSQVDAEHSNTLLPGFSDPVHDSQRAFRQILRAFSHPGTIFDLDGVSQGAPGLSVAATTACLTLLDFETPLWLDDAARGAARYFAFHNATPRAERPSTAAFAVIGRAELLDDFAIFDIGSDEFPERSTTVILEVAGLDNDAGPRLSGPGIEQTARLSITGANDNLWTMVDDNHTLFPRGIDLLLTCRDRVAALPRSVRLERDG